MKADIEALSGIIRIFEDGKDYGDPYCWVAALRFLSKESVEICGSMRMPCTKERRAMFDCLLAYGVTKAMIVRKKDGVSTEHVYEYVDGRFVRTK